MRTGWSASGRHMSVAIEKPRTFIPAWTATRTSGIVDIPTTSAPMALEEPILGPGLEVGPGHRHIDTAMGDDVQLERHAEGQVLQFPVVGLDHVGESWAQTLVVGSDQRVHARAG